MLKKINCWEGKQYKLESSDNYDAYMKELGMGLVQRKFWNSQQPIVLLHKVESTHNLITLVDKKQATLTFKLGKPFEEETFDLRKVTNTMIMIDNTLLQDQQGLPSTKITREFHRTKMIERSVVNKVRAIRVFRALEDDAKEDVTEIIDELEEKQATTPKPKEGAKKEKDTKKPNSFSAILPLP